MAPNVNRIEHPEISIYYLDRIYPSSLKLRRGKQDLQDFLFPFPPLCGERGKTKFAGAEVFIRVYMVLFSYKQFGLVENCKDVFCRDSTFS